MAAKNINRVPDSSTLRETLDKKFVETTTCEAFERSIENLTKDLHPDNIACLKAYADRVRQTLTKEIPEIQNHPEVHKKVITTTYEIAKNLQEIPSQMDQKRGYLSGRYQAAANDDEYRLSA